MAQEETMMAFTAMLSELYGAFRRKVGADEPPAKAAAEAVVIENTRSIDGKLDALSHTIDQRFDALSQRFDAVSQPFDVSRVMGQRFDALSQAMDALSNRVMDQRFDALSHAMDQRLEVLSRAVDQRFDALSQAMDQRLDQRFTAMDVGLRRLKAKTATKFRYLRWGLGIVIALVLGLVTKVILDWAMS